MIVFDSHTRTRLHFTLFDFCIDISWTLISSILRRKANSMSRTFPSSSTITSAVPPISKWSPLIILCIGSLLFPYQYRHYCNGIPIIYVELYIDVFCWYLYHLLRNDPFPTTNPSCILIQVDNHCPNRNPPLLVHMTHHIHKLVSFSVENWEIKLVLRKKLLLW